MSLHGAQHEELLQRILVGDLPAGVSAARQRLRDCPECRAELERLRALDARLVAVVEQEHDDLGQARAGVTAADRERVRRALLGAQPARSAGAPARPRRVPKWGLFALAAGLLLMFGWAANAYLRPAERAPEVLLDAGTIPCRMILDEAGDYGEFSWRYDLQPQGYFTLEIRALDDDGVGEVVVLDVPPLFEPRWTPSPEQQRALPDRIYLEVRAMDGTRGRVLERGSTSVARH